MLNKFLAILFLSFLFLCPSYSETNNWISPLTPKELLADGYSLASSYLLKDNLVIYNFQFNENIVSCVFILESNGGLIDCYNIANSR